MTKCSASEIKRSLEPTTTKTTKNVENVLILITADRCFTVGKLEEEQYFLNFNTSSAKESRYCKISSTATDKTTEEVLSKSH